MLCASPNQWKLMALSRYSKAIHAKLETFQSDVLQYREQSLPIDIDCLNFSRFSSLKTLRLPVSTVDTLLGDVHQRRMYKSLGSLPFAVNIKGTNVPSKFTTLTDFFEATGIIDSELKARVMEQHDQALHIF